MKLTGLLLSFCFILCSSALFAQDSHFILYDYAPLSVNPANTGNYQGTFRVGGIYKDQWSAVNTGAEAFRSPMVYVDAPLLFIDKKEKSWLGAGLGVQLDESGSLNQKTNTFMLSASYNRLVNKKTTFSIGLQGGQRSRSFGDGTAITETSIQNGTDPYADTALGAFNNPSDPTMNPSAGGFIINAGVVLKTQINKTTNFQIGLAGLNINQPNQSLEQTNSKNSEFKLPLRFNLHAGLETELTDKWSLNPTLLVSNIRNQNELLLQIWTDYSLNKEKEIDLRFGLGHRLGRDLQPLIGIDYGPFRAAVGYDIRLGTLGNALSNRGGIEIGVGYIGTIFKKPTVPPSIFCPVL